MATRRRKWPHTAEWARLDALALARSSRTLLLEAAQKADKPEILKALVIAIENQHEIEKKLLEAKGDPNGMDL